MITTAEQSKIESDYREAFRFAFETWNIEPTKGLIEHALLCYRNQGKSPAQIAVEMGWIAQETADQVKKSSNGVKNIIREVDTMIVANQGLERHRQKLLSIAESILWIENLKEEGITPHEDLADPEILRACERSEAILMRIGKTTVLVFGERESGMRRFQQISGMERAQDPIRKKHEKLTFALARTDEIITLRDKKSKSLPSDALAALPQTDSQQNEVITELQMKQEGDALRKLAQMHVLGIAHNASDIHMWMNNEGKPFVAYRVLGDLTEMPIKLTTPEYTKVLNFLLRRSGASIKYEKMREPKDGMYQFVGEKASAKAFVRCSFIPNGHSDNPSRQLISICLRLIPEETGSVVLQEKGVREDVIKALKQAVIPDSGIVLLVGPTGSGKSTTIAGTVDLHRKLHGDTKVRLSIEDPVERFYPGIEQFQVPFHLRGTSEGFSLFLRNFLRHDPNLIWLGEIRDDVTARVAIQAASTGHLVISTLHSETAPKTVQRLSDMIPPEDRSMRAALIDNLSLIVAQRLVKKLCPACSEWSEPSEREREHLDYVNRFKGLDLKLPEKVKNKHEGGCRSCNYSGFAGRLPVNEVLVFTEDVKFIFRDPDPVSQAKKVREALSIKMEECILDAVGNGLTPLSSLEI